MKNRKTGITKWLYWFSLALATIVVYKLLDKIGPIARWVEELFKILMPFIIGLLIAYLFYIPCKKVESMYAKIKKPKLISKKARTLSIITVYLVALLIIIISLNFVIPNVLKSITDFVNNFGNYYNDTMNNIESLPEDSIWKNEIILHLAQSINQIDLKQFLNMENLVQYAKGAIDAVTSIFNIFVALIVSVYLLAERSQILNFMKRLASSIFAKETYLIVSRYFNKSNEVFFRFIASQVLDAIIVGILTSVAMTIIGVKYAILLGFMIGLFNLIPYFGAIIAVVAAIIITLFTGGIGQAVLMAIIVIILQQIDANIINPKIIGNSLSISPLLVIFAVTVGGAYFGVLGMFLAVPVCTVIKLLIEEFIEYKNRENEISLLGESKKIDI